MRLWVVFVINFTIRLLNALTIRTFFQPDEFFQALEPAHKLAFGYGYITWEWHQQLRSALHPLLYAGGYSLVNMVLPSSMEDFGVEIAPKIVSAIIAALGDTFTVRFARSFTRDDRIANLSWVLSLASPWNWYVSTRSFSNNLELAFTVIGLSYWPWHHFKLMSVLVLSFFGFWSCIVRPTNCILWGFLGGGLLIKNMMHHLRIIRLSLSLMAVLSVVVGISTVCDYSYYGTWTFPAINFLEFNVVKNLSVFYGSAPWHFYLFQGVPLMLMGYLPAFAFSLWANRTSVLTALTIFVTTAFSAIAHKEFRFLQPVYPVMLVLAALQLYQWRRSKLLHVGAVFILVAHICVGYFFTRVNEVGEIDVVRYLKNNTEVQSVGFLTPCHSTPWHSMLHRPELVSTSWFLTCEPPLHLDRGDTHNVAAYRDELDQFFDDPAGFLDRKLGHPERNWTNWPSHLVIFEPMEQVVLDYVGPVHYHECARFFNSYFHWDSRRAGDIIVYCKARAVPATSQ